MFSYSNKIYLATLNKFICALIKKKFIYTKLKEIKYSKGYHLFDHITRIWFILYESSPYGGQISKTHVLNKILKLKNFTHPTPPVDPWNAFPLTLIMHLVKVAQQTPHSPSREPFDLISWLHITFSFE